MKANIDGSKIRMNVVIVDDDRLVSMSLKMILEADEQIEVTAVGNDGSEAIELYTRYMPDVLLMDIRMQHMTGIEAAEHILKKYPEAKMLFLTTFSDDEYIVKALCLGVKGYILKQNFEGIVPAIKAVSLGQTVFGGKIVHKLPNLMQNKENFDYSKIGITEKEYTIIELVSQGLSNREIAEKEFLSEGTIRNYLSTILEKLELRDRTQLAVFYYQHGGITSEVR